MKTQGAALALALASALTQPIGAALVVASVPLAFASSAAAQTGSATAAAPHCPQENLTQPGYMLGLWQLSLWTPEQAVGAEPMSKGAVLFERHPEYPGSVRGSLKRSSPGNDLLAYVSGDAVGSEFNLDESADGKSMSAVWVGEVGVVPCGLVVRGTRFPASDSEGTEPQLRFLLSRGSAR